MYYNFPELDVSELDKLLDADICIVGSGAAGITLALQFIRSDKRVVVLEGGVTGITSDSQELYHGATTANGEQLEHYLPSSRLRMFGGSTGHWAGYCRPFDAHDFIARDWIPNSGWPISMQELTPFYEMASALLQIKSFDIDNDLSIPENRFINNERFYVRNYHMSPPTRFHQTFRAGLQKPENISIIFDANVTKLKLAENGSRVESVEIASLNDGTKRAKVKAKQFVLATGGVENAKLLLNSNDVQKNGVGNEQGNVGKYFMEHPEYDAPWAMALDMEDAPTRAFLLFQPTMQLPTLMPTPSTQREHKLLNASIELRHYKPRRLPRDEFVAAASLFEQFSSAKESYKTFTAYVRTEMPPLPENKCYLADDKDVFGNQQVALSFAMNELTDYTLSTLSELVGLELGINNIGRVNTSYQSGDHKTKVGYGSHHMGTTRMSSNTSDGVVDKNCKVFGVSNLYVAGSSVFTTSSYANPTFTIVALALRLAQHLKSVDS